MLDELRKLLGLKSAPKPQVSRPALPANNPVDNSAMRLSSGVATVVAPKPIQGGNLSARLMQSKASDGSVIDNRGRASAVPIHNDNIFFDQLEARGLPGGYLEDGRFHDNRGRVYTGHHF